MCSQMQQPGGGTGVSLMAGSCSPQRMRRLFVWLFVCLLVNRSRYAVGSIPLTRSGSFPCTSSEACERLGACAGVCGATGGTRCLTSAKILRNRLVASAVQSHAT